jgi:hypothetical protein
MRYLTLAYFEKFMGHEKYFRFCWIGIGFSFGLCSCSSQANNGG